MINNLDEAFLQQWIEDSLRDNSHVLAAGYQGKTLLYKDAIQQLVIKVPHGRGIIKYIHRHMLKHEYQVYQKLIGLEGIPRCYGIVNNTYLVIEYINGHPIRSKRPIQQAEYFSKLLSIIEQMHEKQVAHMDLKKKDNLLVTENDLPCMIDFGAAVIRKNGFHPLNHFRYSLGMQFDYNAWIKHKYHDNMQNLSKDDSELYRRTIIERISSLIKTTYRKVMRA